MTRTLSAQRQAGGRVEEVAPLGVDPECHSLSDADACHPVADANP